jgi:hypothetical protein
LWLYLQHPELNLQLSRLSVKLSEKQSGVAKFYFLQGWHFTYHFRASYAPLSKDPSMQDQHGTQLSFTWLHGLLS